VGLQAIANRSPIGEARIAGTAFEAARGKRCVVPDPVIQVSGLMFAYPAGARALDGVTFELAAGESLGLVGPNGAGKTTLFLCLSGVLSIKAGSIRVAGLDPALAADRRLLPGKVGIIFQNSDDQLFGTTVMDDVAFGPLNLGCRPEETRERVGAALRHVGAVGLEQRVPHLLSGGEKRRVALAGVLAMRPEILLLDEPSMFLDPRGRRELIGLLPTLPGSRIVASHDLELILETCQRVLVLDQGRLVADGPAQQLLADAELMDRHGLEVPHSLRKKASGPFAVGP
jgi:cobalt/nickel transport system ATP-binding protein